MAKLFQITRTKAFSAQIEADGEEAARKVFNEINWETMDGLPATVNPETLNTTDAIEVDYLPEAENDATGENVAHAGE